LEKKEGNRSRKGVIWFYLKREILRKKWGGELYEVVKSEKLVGGKGFWRDQRKKKEKEKVKGRFVRMAFLKVWLLYFDLS